MRLLNNNMRRKDNKLYKKVISLTLSIIFFFFSVYVPNPVYAGSTGSNFGNPGILNMPVRSSYNIFGNITIPEERGIIKTRYKGRNGNFIIHIQDAHVNYEGQKNLSLILKDLVERYGIDLVLVEGGWGELDLSFLRHFGTKEIRKKIADRYLREGKIAGEEYLDIVEEPTTDFDIYGIEDRSLYNSNLRQFLKIDRFVKKADDFITSLQNSLSILKERFYSPGLKEFERNKALYETEKMDLVDYCEYLRKNYPEDAYTQIDLLLRLKRFEGYIDFDKVNIERDRYISSLSKHLSREDLNALLKKSFDFKRGIISSLEYYTYIKDLAKDAGLDIRDYPNLNLYTYYIRLFEGMDRQTLFKELSHLEDNLRETLSINAIQKRLGRITRDLALMKDFVNLKLVPQDLKEYHSRRKDFNLKKWCKFINGLAKSQDIPSAFVYYTDVIDKNLNTLEEFYNIAKKRDNAFINNLGDIMQKRDRKSAVLIAGGFHTENLTPLFKENGYSYIVISPKVAPKTDFQLYRSLLKGRLSAKEKLIKAIFGSLRVQALVNRPVILDTLIAELTCIEEIIVERGLRGRGISKGMLHTIRGWQSEEDRRRLLPERLLTSQGSIKPDVHFVVDTERNVIQAVSNNNYTLAEYSIDNNEWEIFLSPPQGISPKSMSDFRPYKDVIASYTEGSPQYIVADLVEKAIRKTDKGINQIYYGVPFGVNDTSNETIRVVPVKKEGDPALYKNYYISPHFIDNIAKLYEKTSRLAQDIINDFVIYCSNIPLTADIKDVDKGLQKNLHLTEAERENLKLNPLATETSPDYGTYRDIPFNKREVLTWIENNFSSRVAGRYLFYRFCVVGGINKERDLKAKIYNFINNPPRNISHNLFWLGLTNLQSRCKPAVEYAVSSLNDYNGTGVIQPSFVEERVATLASGVTPEEEKGHLVLNSKLGDADSDVLILDNRNNIVVISISQIMQTEKENRPLKGGFRYLRRRFNRARVKITAPANIPIYRDELNNIAKENIKKNAARQDASLRSLVITRKDGESFSIVLGGNIISIEVFDIKSDGAKFRINAPHNIPVYRRKVYERIRGEGGRDSTAPSGVTPEEIREKSQQIPLIDSVIDSSIKEALNARRYLAVLEDGVVSIEEYTERPSYTPIFEILEKVIENLSDETLSAILDGTELDSIDFGYEDKSRENQEKDAVRQRLQDLNITPAQLKEGLLGLFKKGSRFKIYLIEPKEEIPGLKVPGILLTTLGSNYGHYSIKNNSVYIPWNLVDMLLGDMQEGMTPDQMTPEQRDGIANILHELIEFVIVKRAFPDITTTLRPADLSQLEGTAHIVAQMVEREIAGPSRQVQSTPVQLGPRSALDDRLDDITASYFADRRRFRESEAREETRELEKDLGDVDFVIGKLYNTDIVVSSYDNTNKEIILQNQATNKTLHISILKARLGRGYAYFCKIGNRTYQLIGDRVNLSALLRKEDANDILFWIGNKELLDFFGLTPQQVLGLDIDEEVRGAKPYLYYTLLKDPISRTAEPELYPRNITEEDLAEARDYLATHPYNKQASYNEQIERLHYVAILSRSNAGLIDNYHQIIEDMAIVTENLTQLQLSDNLTVKKLADDIFSSISIAVVRDSRERPDNIPKLSGEDIERLQKEKPFVIENPEEDFQRLQKVVARQIMSGEWQPYVLINIKNFSGITHISYIDFVRSISKKYGGNITFVISVEDPGALRGDLAGAYTARRRAVDIFGDKWWLKERIITVPDGGEKTRAANAGVALEQWSKALTTDGISFLEDNILTGGVMWLLLPKLGEGKEYQNYKPWLASDGRIRFGSMNLAGRPLSQLPDDFVLGACGIEALVMTNNQINAVRERIALAEENASREGRDVNEAAKSELKNILYNTEIGDAIRSNIDKRELIKRGIFAVKEDGEMAAFLEKGGGEDLPITQRYVNVAFLAYRYGGKVYENLWFILEDSRVALDIIKRFAQTPTQPPSDEVFIGRVPKVSTFKEIFQGILLNSERSWANQVRGALLGESKAVMPGENKRRPKIYGISYGEDAQAADIASLGNYFEMWERYVREYKGPKEIDVDVAEGITINYRGNRERLKYLLRNVKFVGKGQVVIGDGVVIQGGTIFVDGTLNIPDRTKIIDSQLLGPVVFENEAAMVLCVSFEPHKYIYYDRGEQINTLKIYGDETTTTQTYNDGTTHIVRFINSVDYKAPICKIIGGQDRWATLRNRFGLIDEKFKSYKDVVQMPLKEVIPEENWADLVFFIFTPSLSLEELDTVRNRLKTLADDYAKGSIEYGDLKYNISDLLKPIVSIRATETDEGFFDIMVEEIANLIESSRGVWSDEEMNRLIEMVYKGRIRPQLAAALRKVSYEEVKDEPYGKALYRILAAMHPAIITDDEVNHGPLSWNNISTLAGENTDGWKSFYNLPLYGGGRDHKSAKKETDSSAMKWIVKTRTYPASTHLGFETTTPSGITPQEEETTAASRITPTEEIAERYREKVRGDIKKVERVENFVIVISLLKEDKLLWLFDSQDNPVEGAQGINVNNGYEFDTPYLLTIDKEHLLTLRNVSTNTIMLRNIDALSGYIFNPPYLVINHLGGVYGFNYRESKNLMTEDGRLINFIFAKDGLKGFTFRQPYLIRWQYPEVGFGQRGIYVVVNNIETKEEKIIREGTMPPADWLPGTERIQFMEPPYLLIVYPKEKTGLKPLTTLYLIDVKTGKIERYLDVSEYKFVTYPSTIHLTVTGSSGKTTIVLPTQEETTPSQGITPEEATTASVQEPDILEEARMAGLILKTQDMIRERRLVPEEKLQDTFRALLKYARYTLGKEEIPRGKKPMDILISELQQLGITHPESIFDQAWQSVREALKPENLAKIAQDYEGLLAVPKFNFVQKRPLDYSLIKKPSPRELSKVLEKLEGAQQKGITLEIEGAMRAFDGMGSSMDLPFPQWMFTMLGITNFDAFPMTPTVASEYKARISFKLANPEYRDKIVYIAPQYGITKDKPLIRGEEDIFFDERGVITDKEGTNPQALAPHFIFMKIFGLKGIEISVESIDLLPKEGGGMESSNVANIALVSAASILSGANLSEADIFNLAVKIENDELGGLTGGQGHRCCQLGGIFAHVWLSGIKGEDGNLINPYSVFSIPLITNPQAVKILEEHFMFAQAGKPYENGKPKIGRQSDLTNELWTVQVEDFDEIGFPRFFQKVAQTSKGIKALMSINRHAEAAEKGDQEAKQAIQQALQDIIEALNEYVDIRDEVALRAMNLTFDALHKRPDLPKYAREYPQKKFFEMVKEELKRLQEEEGMTYEEAEKHLRTHSLYTYGPIKELIEAARKEGMAVMPLGAGGPGSTLIVVSPEGKEHLLNFFKSQGMEELTNEKIKSVIDNSSHRIVTLRGYAPFKVSLEPIQYKGFEELGFVLPEKAKPTRFSELRQKKFILIGQTQETTPPQGAEPEEGLSFEKQIEVAQNFLEENHIDKSRLVIDKVKRRLGLDLSHTEVTNLEPLSGLTNLQGLDLSHTPVTNLEPLSGLTNLQELNLSFTLVTNLEPLRALTNLQSLNLYFISFAPITNFEPLRALTNLQELNLSFTLVTNLEPLSGLTNLQWLDLSHTEVTNLEPLSGLTNLQWLDLSYTEVTNLEPLRALTNLQWLDLHLNRVTNLEPLSGLTNLQELNLSRTGVTNEEIYTILQHHPNREDLVVINNQGSEVKYRPESSQEGPETTPPQGAEPEEELSFEKQIEVAQNFLEENHIDKSRLVIDKVKRTLGLNLSYTLVTNLEPLSGLTNLQELNLHFTQVTNLEPLRVLTNLQELNLSYTLVTNLEPLRALTNLQELDLFSTRVTNLELLSGLTNLQGLDLSYTGVTNLEPLRALTNLQWLDLSYTGVTNLEPLRALTNLQWLDLHLNRVTNLEPLSGLTNLQELNLSRTGVTNEEIYTILQHHPNREDLVVINNQGSEVKYRPESSQEGPETTPPQGAEPEEELRKGWLVFTRDVNESVVIDKDIIVSVNKIRRAYDGIIRKVILGINAPEDVLISRGELVTKEFFEDKPLPKKRKEEKRKKRGQLVLSRKMGERVFMRRGEDIIEIELHAAEAEGYKLRLSVRAPKHIRVLRKELLHRRGDQGEITPPSAITPEEESPEEPVIIQEFGTSYSITPGVVEAVRLMRNIDVIVVDKKGKNNIRLRSYLDKITPEGDSLIEKVSGVTAPKQRGNIITHWIPEELYNLNKTVWENVERSFNNGNYRINSINLSDIQEGLRQEELARQIIKRLNGSSADTSVLYLPLGIIKALGEEGINLLREHATLVSYRDQIENRAIFAQGLIAFGEVLREVYDTKDINKYRGVIDIIYKAVTHNTKRHITEEELNLIFTRPYEFLIRIVIEFPPIKPELQKSLIEYQKQKVIEAITELAV